MLIQTAGRKISIAAFAAALFVADFALFHQAALAQAPATGSAASPTASQPEGKTLTEFLIGEAVPDGTANSQQYKDVTEAITRFGNNDFEGARKLFTDARAKNPKLPPVEILMARLWAFVRQPAAGRAELEKAVMAHADDPEAYLFFGEADLQDRRVATAEAVLEKAKPLIDKFTQNQKRKRNFDIRWNAGMAAAGEARERWDVATKYLTDLLALQPDVAVSVAAHQRLARAMFKSGKDRVPVFNELEAALKADPKATNPYIAMAALYEEDKANNEKSHEEAKKMLDLADKKFPKDLNVHLQAARFALATGETKDAEKYVVAALALDPKSVEAKVIRGEVARFAGDLKTAIKYLEEASNEQRRNLEASNQLALSLIDTDKEEDKQRGLELAQINWDLTTRENRISPEVASTYAWALYRTGNKTGARDIVRQLISLQQISPDTAYYVGKMLQDEGNLENAIKFLEAALNVPTPFAQRDATTKLLADIKREKEKKDKEDKGTTPTSTSEKSSEKGKK